MAENHSNARRIINTDLRGLSSGPHGLFGHTSALENLDQIFLFAGTLERRQDGKAFSTFIHTDQDGKDLLLGEIDGAIAEISSLIGDLGAHIEDSAVSESLPSGWGNRITAFSSIIFQLNEARGHISDAMPLLATEMSHG